MSGETPPIEEAKRKILFISRAGNEVSTPFIIDDLKKDYAITPQEELDYSLFPFLRDREKDPDFFRAMITPVRANQVFLDREEGESSYDFRLKNYSFSLRLLASIKSSFPSMALIGYTRAESCEEIDKMFRSVGKLSTVVHVSSPQRWRLDCLHLRQALDDCLRR